MIILWMLLGMLLMAVILLNIKIWQLKQDITTLSSFPREYKSLLENLPIPVWTRDPKGSIAFSNQPEIDSDRLKKIHTQAMRQNQSVTQKQVISLNNQRKVLQVTEIPQEEGGSIGYALDLTQEDFLEKAIQEHIKGHHGVLEQLSSAITIYDSEMRLRFFNHAYVHMFGLSSNWLATAPTLPQVLDELLNRRMIAEHANFSAYKRERIALFSELRESFQELEHLPDERAIRRLCSPHPQGGVFFVFEDVTNALMLERKYNTLAAVQRETIDHLSEGVMVVGGDGRLTLYNQAFCKIWKLSPKDLAHNPHISDLIDHGQKFLETKGSWDDFKQTMIQSLTDRSPKKGKIKRKDKMVLEYCYTPLPDGGNLVSYTDVTSNDKVKQVLVQRNDALEKADRLKADFIAHVSYELRSPLNSILGFTEMLSKKYFGPLTDKQDEYISNIQEASSQLLSLINDILDLSSMEAGYASLQFSEINIKKMVQGVMEMVEPLTFQKGVEFKGFFPKNTLYMWGDERRLKQILTNLLFNAIQFTSSGGSINLYVTIIDDTIVFSIKDTGCGISKKDQRRLFQKFERGSIGSNGGSQGAGLGLAIVKQLVELHGGQVKLTSKIKEGTEVTCLIPLHKSCPISSNVFTETQESSRNG